MGVQGDAEAHQNENNWEAAEDQGYTPERLQFLKRIGMVIGCYLFIDIIFVFFFYV